MSMTNEEHNDRCGHVKKTSTTKLTSYSLKRMVTDGEKLFTCITDKTYKDNYTPTKKNQPNKKMAKT